MLCLDDGFRGLLKVMDMSTTMMIATLIVFVPCSIWAVQFTMWPVRGWGGLESYHGRLVFGGGSGASKQTPRNGNHLPFLNLALCILLYCSINGYHHHTLPTKAVSPVPCAKPQLPAPVLHIGTSWSTLGNGEKKSTLFAPIFRL